MKKIVNNYHNFHFLIYLLLNFNLFYKHNLKKNKILVIFFKSYDRSTMDS